MNMYNMSTFLLFSAKDFPYMDSILIRNIKVNGEVFRINPKWPDGIHVLQHNMLTAVRHGQVSIEMFLSDESFSRFPPGPVPGARQVRKQCSPVPASEINGHIKFIFPYLRKKTRFPFISGHSGQHLDCPVKNKYLINICIAFQNLFGAGINKGCCAGRGECLFQCPEYWNSQKHVADMPEFYYKDSIYVMQFHS